MSLRYYCPVFKVVEVFSVHGYARKLTSPAFHSLFVFSI